MAQSGLLRHHYTAAVCSSSIAMLKGNYIINVYTIYKNVHYEPQALIKVLRGLGGSPLKVFKS